jgi:hypothetical protein
MVGRRLLSRGSEILKCAAPRYVVMQFGIKEGRKAGSGSMPRLTVDTMSLPFPLQFSLPMPKGGRRGNIILREDQSEYLRSRPKVGGVVMCSRWSKACQISRRQLTAPSCSIA